MDMKEAASAMRSILGLSYEPIAVKFLENQTSLDGFEMPSKPRSAAWGLWGNNTSSSA